MNVDEGRNARRIDGHERVGSVAIGTLLLIILTGCDYSRAAQYSVQQRDDRLKLAVCEDTDVLAIRVSANTGFLGTSRTFWHVDGDVALRVGNQLEVLSTPEGMIENRASPENAIGATSYTINVSGDPGGASSYRVPEDPDVWVYWDGTTGSTPCPE